jgi:hypothetical protein
LRLRRESFGFSGLSVNHGFQGVALIEERIQTSYTVVRSWRQSGIIPRRPRSFRNFETNWRQSGYSQENVMKIRMNPRFKLAQPLPELPKIRVRRDGLDAVGLISPLEADEQAQIPAGANRQIQGQRFVLAEMVRQQEVEKRKCQDFLKTDCGKLTP